MLYLTSLFFFRSIKTTTETTFTAYRINTIIGNTKHKTNEYILWSCCYKLQCDDDCKKVYIKEWCVLIEF